MKALVVGTDYFADRFKYLLDKEGLYVREAAKLPSDPEYDIVFFSGASCTPANIRRALKNGADVFSEQIIFDGAEDVSVVEDAKEQGSKLYIGSFNIFNPVVRQMAKLIEGRDVLGVRLDRIGPVSHSNIDIVEDSLLHGIGTLRYLIGSKDPSIDIMACFSDKARSRCTLVMRVGKVDGQLHASNINEYKERTIDIFCKTLRIRGDLLSQEIQILDAKKSDQNLCDAGAWSFRRYYVRKEEPLRVLIRNFLRHDRNPVSLAFTKSVLDATLTAKKMLPRSG